MTRGKASACGSIESVLPASVAGRVGLQPGDCLVAVNGHEVRDVIDAQLYAAEEELRLEFLRGDALSSVTVSRAYDEPLGLEFRDLLFDGIRTCRNRCEFCFVAQMPRGLRPTLYIRDDDYRLSFLTGSFVTLTNLREEDWQRIEEQHLSPLYVSVHATDSQIREEILQMRGTPDVRTQLSRLAEIGIETHCQVVAVPGTNDGPVLDQTIEDLAALHPSVASVSIVPVGLTRFHAPGLARYSSVEARVLLAQVDPWRARFHEAWGVNFVYPSDEFYLLARKAIPAASAYAGFPQAENGVGLVRLFLEDWRRTRRRLRKDGWNVPYRRMTWVTGELFAPQLERVARWLKENLGGTVDVVPVPNRFFGETVTVAGLLTAEDVVDALTGVTLGDAICLPLSMLDRAGGVTLDGRSSAWLGQRLDTPVFFADTISDLLPRR